MGALQRFTKHWVAVIVLLLLTLMPSVLVQGQNDEQDWRT
jgi:hypothetical protein